jgi:hypothetical protein
LFHLWLSVEILSDVGLLSIFFEYKVSEHLHRNFNVDNNGFTVKIVAHFWDAAFIGLI